MEDIGKCTNTPCGDSGWHSGDKQGASPCLSQWLLLRRGSRERGTAIKQGASHAGVHCQFASDGDEKASAWVAI